MVIWPRPTTSRLSRHQPARISAIDEPTALSFGTLVRHGRVRLATGQLDAGVRRKPPEDQRGGGRQRADDQKRRREIGGAHGGAVLHAEREFHHKGTDGYAGG